MIENHAQFQVTQEQIQRLEQALEQLRQTASTAEFMAQAPAVVEHIRRMRAEIDVSARPKVFWYHISLYNSTTIRYVKPISGAMSVRYVRPLTEQQRALLESTMKNDAS